MPDRSQLFADIDSLDPDAFAQHLAPDAVMRFGNADPVEGRDAIRGVWADFCAGIDGVCINLVRNGHRPGVVSAVVPAPPVTVGRSGGAVSTVSWIGVEGALAWPAASVAVAVRL